MKFELFVVVCLLVLVIDRADARPDATTLTVKYPYINLQQGDTLFVRGSSCGLNWQQGVALTQGKGADGMNVWTTEIDMSGCDSSTFEYKSLVNDAQWQIGANSKKLESFPWFFSSEGEYSVMTSLTSEVLGNTRDVIVWTPPSYKENTLKIYEDVLIMHDGQNVFNASTSFLGQAWNIQDTMNPLIVEGIMREIVVVALYNTADRMDDYTYSYDKEYGFGGKGDEYLDFIEKKAITWIQDSSGLRVPKQLTRDNLGILGSSLGGLISCYAGWTRSHVYGISGCMSSSFWWNSQDFLNMVLKKPKPQQTEIFYLDSGNAGPGGDDYNETIAVRQNMISQGWVMNSTVFYYLDNGGRHNEYYWGQRFHVPMTYLYPANN